MHLAALMRLAVDNNELPNWATQYGLAGVIVAALIVVVRVLFKQLETRHEAERELLLSEHTAERARADRLEAQLARYADDERKRYGELVEAMKAIGDELRADRGRT